MRKIFHKIFVGNVVWQLLVWGIAFFVVFWLLKKGLSIDTDSLFHSMTTYDKETDDFYYVVFHQTVSQKSILRIIYIIGVAFFSGLLVMILTNAIRNLINKIERGDNRYGFNKHVVIFGYNEFVLGLLLSYMNDKIKHEGIILSCWHKLFKTKYLIVVEKDVSKVKEEITGMLGKRRNLYILHGSRLSVDDIKGFRVNKAKDIYMIGEGEPNVDVLNLQSLHLISTLIDLSKNRNVFLYNSGAGGLCSWDYCTRFLSRKFLDSSFLKIIDSDELCINNILGDPDNNWPNYKLHRRGEKDVINWQSEKKVHMVIIGMNDVSKKLIKAASNFAHFPNHSTKKINTLITVVDENIGDASFIINEFKDYFDYCHYEIKSTKNNTRITHAQLEKYNFIDIDFEFVETDYKNPSLNNLLKEWSIDSSQFLSVYTCIKDLNVCFDISVNFPKELYTNNIPIWLYSKSTAQLSKMLKENYSNIIPWGNPSEQKAFSNWDRDRTSAICAVIKNNHNASETIKYYPAIYGFVSFLPILHTSISSYNTSEETKSLISTEYYRNCVSSLFDRENKVTNVFASEELCEAGYAQSEICNFDDLPKIVRKYYLYTVEDIGLGIFQGKPLKTTTK